MAVVARLRGRAFFRGAKSRPVPSMPGRSTNCSIGEGVRLVLVTIESADPVRSRSQIVAFFELAPAPLPRCQPSRRAAVYPPGMKVGVITADMIKVTLDKSKAVPVFVSAAINSEYCKRQVATFTAGITRPKVTLRDFRRLKITLPSLDFQRSWSDLAETIRRAQRRAFTGLETMTDLFNALVQRAFRGEL